LFNIKAVSFGHYGVRWIIILFFLLHDIFNGKLLQRRIQSNKVVSLCLTVYHYRLPDFRRRINSFMNEHNPSDKMRISGITSDFRNIIKQLPAMLLLPVIISLIYRNDKLCLGLFSKEKKLFMEFRLFPARSQTLRASGTFGNALAYEAPLHFL